MTQVRLNPLMKERDFETVNYGSLPYAVEKIFRVYDFEFARFLFIENYKRKKTLKYDYYQFQFNSEELNKINDLMVNLKAGVHDDVPVVKEEVKAEPKKEVKSVVSESKPTKKLNLKLGKGKRGKN